MPDLYLILAPLLLAPIVGLLRFIGCNQILGNQLAVLATTVEVLPTKASLGPGRQKMFNVLVNGGTPDPSSIQWSAALDPSLHKHNDGNYTAPYPWRDTNDTVTVNYAGDSSTGPGSDTATVKLDHATVSIAPTSVPMLKAGAAVKFTASASNVQPPGGSVKFTWEKAVADTPNGPNATYTAPSPYVLDSGPETVSFTIDADPAPNGSSSATVTLVGNAAIFQKKDIATKGKWITVYGNKGWALADSPNLVSTTPPPPVTAFSFPINEYPYTINGDGRDLQDPTKPGSFIAAVWFTPVGGDHFDIQLQFTDFQPHQFSVYCATWDGFQRTQFVAIYDGDNPGGPALDQQKLDDTVAPGFDTGVYLVWRVSGHVILRVTNDTADNPTSRNAVISGIFFD
ncbi:MAG TPA: hypothetical protein VEU11_10370 [Terriglobales bacterium]|nr:hypothetical protein [Terriglobales bacterium]